MSEQIFKDKIVSIIGSAGEIEDNDYSEIIKKSDLVIRVNTRILNNKIYLPEKVIKNTTNRINVCVHTGLIGGECVCGKNDSRISYTDNVCFTENNFKIYYVNNIKTFMFPPHRINIIKQHFSSYVKDLDIELIGMKQSSYKGGCLTTGLNCINEICESKPKEIYIFGFDCYKGEKINYTNHVEIGVPENMDINLYKTGQNQNYGSHNHDKEFGFLYNLCVKNNIIIQKHLFNLFQKNKFDVSKLNLYK